VAPQAFAAPAQSDEAVVPLGLIERPVRSPIDELRDYLQQPQVLREPLMEQRQPWLSGDLFHRLGFLLALCLLMIAVGFGIVFGIDRPTFGQSANAFSPPPSPQSEAGGTVLVEVQPSPSFAASTPAATSATESSEDTDATAAQVIAAPASDAPVSSTTVPPASTASPSLGEQTGTTTRAGSSGLTPAPTESSSGTAPSDALGPTATTEFPSAVTLLRRVVAAEAMLQSGQFDATIDYAGGNGSSATVSFDFGPGQRMPRFQIASAYKSSSGTQTVERVTIGDQSWERHPDGTWAERAPQEGVTDQVQVFLPHANAITSAQLAIVPNGAVLSWYDADRDVDVTLAVDPSTGVPRELREVTRFTGSTLMVTYTDWNSPVDINPPK
jgi:hypothetical protein